MCLVARGWPSAQKVRFTSFYLNTEPSHRLTAHPCSEFKKIPDDEKLNAFKGLLKCMSLVLVVRPRHHLIPFHIAYQQEIDNLTKRSKVAESAFLNVYKVLAEAPDPYPLLEAVVEQTITSEANTSLTAEVNALKAEVARHKGENVELKRENGTLDATKKRVETLEGKVGVHALALADDLE